MPNAVNLPFNEWDNVADHAQERDDLTVLRQDGINVIYGYSGTDTVAREAAMLFASMGYPVRLLDGGYACWDPEKYTVEIPAPGEDFYSQLIVNADVY